MLRSASILDSLQCTIIQGPAKKKSAGSPDGLITYTKFAAQKTGKNGRQKVPIGTSNEG